MTALHYPAENPFFFCTPDAAVEAAYLLNTAEAKAFEYRNKRDVGEILANYCDGSLSVEEAVEQLEQLD